MNYDTISLSKTEKNKKYTIVSIDNSPIPTKKLLGHGIRPGEKICVLFANPSKTSLAFEVMGAVIALRKKDCEKIFVKEVLR